jgi:hypothetical protein
MRRWKKVHVCSFGHVSLTGRRFIVRCSRPPALCRGPSRVPRVMVLHFHNGEPPSLPPYEHIYFLSIAGSSNQQLAIGARRHTHFPLHVKFLLGLLVEKRHLTLKRAIFLCGY